MKKESPPSGLTLSLINLAKDPMWKSVIQIAGGLTLLALIVGAIFFALTGVGIPVAAAFVLALNAVYRTLKKI